MRIATLILLLTGTVGAQPLQPFEAEFRLHVSKIPTTIKATLELTALEQTDHYRMRMENRSFMVRNREESRFAWNDCAPQSLHYEHEFRGFGIRREHSMEFDWQASEVLFNDGKDKGRYAIEQGTLDELTMLLKAQCLLSEGKTEFTLTAAYGDRVRSHTFVVTGEEEIETPAGKIQTLVLEKRRKADSTRRTVFWVAPSLQYMLVKARHVENRALFGELLMRSYRGPAPDSSIGLPLSDNDDAAAQ
jgi:hypothetical protein